MAAPPNPRHAELVAAAQAAIREALLPGAVPVRLPRNCSPSWGRSGGVRMPTMATT